MGDVQEMKPDTMSETCNYNTEFFSRLIVESESMSLEELKRMFSARPTEEWSIGDIIRRPRTVLHRRTSGFCYKTKRVPQEDWNSHVENLIAMVSGIGQKHVDNHMYRAEIRIGIDHYCPEECRIVIPKQLLASAFRIGAAIDIDILYLSDEESSNSCCQSTTLPYKASVCVVQHMNEQQKLICEKNGMDAFQGACLFLVDALRNGNENIDSNNFLTFCVKGESPIVTLPLDLIRLVYNRMELVIVFRESICESNGGV